MTSTKVLKILLLFGVVYFFMVGWAHFNGFKIPGLYLYFNVPSYAYQDKIISLLSLGWACFFYVSFLTPTKSLIRSILLAGAIAIIVLITINLTTDFKSLDNHINVEWFYLETAVLFVYWLCVLIAYKSSERRN